MGREGREEAMTLRTLREVIMIVASSEIMSEMMERQIMIASWCMFGFQAGSAASSSRGLRGVPSSTQMTASSDDFDVKTSMASRK
jgi:hypothetical protein